MLACPPTQDKSAGATLQVILDELSLILDETDPDEPLAVAPRSYVARWYWVAQHLKLAAMASQCATVLNDTALRDLLAHVPMRWLRQWQTHVALAYLQAQWRQV